MTWDPDEEAKDSDWVADLTLFETYFAIARACYTRVLALASVVSAEVQVGRPPGDINTPTRQPGLRDEEGFSEPVWDSEDKSVDAQRRRLMAVSVVFSALTLEAFINSYGHNKLGEDVVKLLDRIPIGSKWSLYPELACKKRLTTGGAALNAVKKLFQLRDALVHAKPRTAVYSENRPLPEDAIDETLRVNPVKLVDDVLKGLKEVDPSVNVAWASRTPRGRSWEHFL